MSFTPKLQSIINPASNLPSSSSPPSPSPLSHYPSYQRYTNFSSQCVLAISTVSLLTSAQSPFRHATQCRSYTNTHTHHTHTSRHSLHTHTHYIHHHPHIHHTQTHTLTLTTYNKMNNNDNNSNNSIILLQSHTTHTAIIRPIIHNRAIFFFCLLKV